MWNNIPTLYKLEMDSCIWLKVLNLIFAVLHKKWIKKIKNSDSVAMAI